MYAISFLFLCSSITVFFCVRYFLVYTFLCHYYKSCIFVHYMIINNYSLMITALGSCILNLLGKIYTHTYAYIHIYMYILEFILLGDCWIIWIGRLMIFFKYRKFLDIIYSNIICAHFSLLYFWDSRYVSVATLDGFPKDLCISVHCSFLFSFQTFAADCFHQMPLGESCLQWASFKSGQIKTNPVYVCF